MKKIEFLIAKNICTFFHLGYLSKMPGTLGSIVGLVLGFIVLSYLSYLTFIFFFVLLLLISLYSIYAYQLVIGKSDKSEIIIDEIVGQLIPLAYINLNYLEIFFAFILFRFFDIFKLYPANIIDKKYSNHYGVMFDDIIAGLQATIVLYLFDNLYDKL